MKATQATKATEATKPTKANICRLALCAALQACSAQAYSHAFLDHARPAVGSAVHGSPAGVSLWFTAPLEPAFSTLRVMDANGKQVDRKDKEIDRNNPAQIRVTLPPLPNGSYRVIWRVLSVDTHVTDGEFAFEITP